MWYLSSFMARASSDPKKMGRRILVPFSMGLQSSRSSAEQMRTEAQAQGPAVVKNGLSAIKPPLKMLLFLGVPIP